MISKFITLPLFIAAGVVAHPTIMRRADIPSLSQWASSGLESFWTFRVRYESLDCASQTGTDFYTTCCYPLPASQDPSTLPSECTPATLTCSSNGPWNSTVSVTTPTPSDTPIPTPAYTPQPTDGGGDDTSSSDQSYNNTDNSSDQNNGNTDSGDGSSGTDSTDSWNGNGSGGGNNTNSGNNNSGNNNNNGSSGSSSSGGGNVVTGGFATYYYQNGNPGACGNYNSDSALIGAIDIAWYGNTGAVSQYCGRSVQITNLNNGKTVEITVADVCPTCDTSNSFDLSVGAFSAIADLSDGEVPITWFFN